MPLDALDNVFYAQGKVAPQQLAAVEETEKEKERTREGGRTERGEGQRKSERGGSGGWNFIF